MTAEAFRTWVDAQPAALGSEWVGTLEERKQEEAHFHDTDRLDHRDEVAANSSNRRFYESMSPARTWMAEWVTRHAPGAIVLDYACGHGSQALKAVHAGAALAVGIDVSEVSVGNARELADRAGFAESTRFLQRDCEATGFPDNTFDAAICSGMLHHLDLERALPELHRVMKPGGRILCFEALSYNPIIRLYRRWTPHLRTEWERQHILGMKDLRMARRWFSVENVHFFNILSPLAILLPAGWPRQAALRVLTAIDSALTRIPLVQLLSWVFVFELVKGESKR
ncbi:MAG: class I SAM-dependent methyltransferase [Gemmatimonadaceae bacterium]|nr:class I SAM-dependent methyltransferase [Gemmatimonadaceae bacterium]